LLVLLGGNTTKSVLKRLCVAGQIVKVCGVHAPSVSGKRR
jgi:hypothetical protein